MSGESMPKKKSKSAPKSSHLKTPGYGFPKGSKGLVPWSWAEQRLKRSHNYWITTVKPDASPHSMVVWGLWQDGRFLFSTGTTSRKARNLSGNPHCVICTEDASEAVIVEGTALVSSDTRFLKRFARLYEKKYDWDMSTFAEPVYVVIPSVAFGLPEDNFAGRVTRWTFR